jgi:hypothetical protein
VIPVICFKVTFVGRKSGPSLHRFRGAFTFPEFQSVANHLWGCRRVKIEYSDDDGDVIAVGSPLEWAECIRLHVERQELRKTADPLRLTVTKASTKDVSSAEAAPATAAAAPAGEDDDVGAPDERPRERSSTVPPVVPPLALPRTDPAPAHPLPAFAVHGVENSVLALLSALYSCNAAEELVKRIPDVDMSATVQRVVDPATMEVRLDIDMRAAHRASVVQGNALMDQGKAADALLLLRAASRVFPRDSIVEYNAACAAALVGESDAGLDFLEAAVRDGYHNDAKIRQDEDLASLRGLPRYDAILGLFAPAPPAPAPAVEPVAAASPPPAAIAVEVAPLATTRTRTVMSIFPQLSAADAKQLLERHRNVVAAAVDAKLSE